MAVATGQGIDRIAELLGDEASNLLEHESKTIDRSLLHLPGPDFVDRVVAQSDRSNAVLRNLQLMFDHGRLGGTGFMSVLPVDQGIEHSAGASFAPNPAYFDPANIVELAIEGGCNAVASTIGVLGAVSRRYAHRIPFIVKINHNELLAYPNIHDQTMYGSVQKAFEMGAVAVGATIYFGSDQSRRQIIEVSEAFETAHELGLATVLWCYLRNSAFKKDGVDYHVAADLTGQANHLGVTIEADIIKQKLPEKQRRLPGAERRRRHVRAHEQEGVLRPHDRPPDRPHALPGRQLLHGPRAPDQQRRRVLRRGRSRPGRAHRGDQQAGRRRRSDQRPQGLPAPHRGGGRDPERDSGRLPLRRRDNRVAAGL